MFFYFLKELFFVQLDISHSDHDDEEKEGGASKDGQNNDVKRSVFVNNLFYVFRISCFAVFFECCL